MTMFNDYNIIIPARMQSTRMSQKLIQDVAGFPLIIRTAKQALLANPKKVVVATDHNTIVDLCHQYDILAILTSPNHQSGTERLAEACEKLQLHDNEIVVNVQGDEPLIKPQVINDLASFIYQKQCNIATVAHEIKDSWEIFNPDFVKVILDKNNYALYFSRATIPFYRDGFTNKENLQLPPNNFHWLRHMGIYAYSVHFLKTYHQLTPSPLEEIEKLEQLRVLYHGYKIAVLCIQEHLATGVDTMEDLKKVREILNTNK